MIEINLKPGAKRQAAKSGPAFAGLKSQLSELTSGVKDPWAVAAGIACVVVVLGLGGLFLKTGSAQAALEPQLEEARAEQRRYQGFLREKRRAESVRDSILVQIGTIASVDGNRYVWPHILDEVQSALPEMTWLTQLAQIGGGAMTPAAPAPRGGAKDRGQRRVRRGGGRDVPGHPHHRPDRRPPALHRIPAAARGQSVDRKRPAGAGQDHRGRQSRPHGVHHSGDLLAGRLVPCTDGADPRVGGGGVTHG